MSENQSAVVECDFGDCVVSTDAARLDLNVIHGFLRGAYWSECIPRETLRRAIGNSLCFGVYADGRQVGFGRVVTDRATFAYIADVFVLESHRGRGFSKRLMETIMGHPELQGLRRWSLGTRDAHGLYRQFGFAPPPHPDRQMDIIDFDIYRRNSASTEDAATEEAR